MDFKKFIVIPVFIAVLASLFIVIDQLISPYMPIADNKGFGWVTLPGMGLVFSCRRYRKRGTSHFYGLCLGYSLCNSDYQARRCSGNHWFLGSSFGRFGDGYSNVFNGKGTFLNRFRPCNICFFGSFLLHLGQIYGKGTTDISSAITILVYCAIAMVLGYITVSLRTAYEKRVAK